MKKSITLSVLFVLATYFAIAQNIPDAPNDKAVVYFARTSSLGFAINFVYFDSLQAIGRFNGPKYMRYECEPGKHLFWARSENRDFVEADLEAGKIYFIEVEVKMGAVKAGVELSPVDPKDVKTMGKILKLMDKRQSESFTTEELETITKNYNDVVERGFNKYNEDKQKGKVIKKLDRSMFYSK